MTARVRPKRVRMHCTLFGACAVFAAAQTAAFGIGSLPEGDKEEVRREHSSRRGVVEALILQFGQPSHEEILGRSYGCTARPCWKADMPGAVLAGLIWADMPSGHPVGGRWSGCKNRNIGLQLNGKLAAGACTMGYVIDGGKRSRGAQKTFYGEDHLNLYRTHFGDMQWMHAMAEHRGDEAQKTKQAMLAWARYLYGLSTTVAAEQIAINKPLSQVEPIAPLFSHDKRAWTSMTLFGTAQASAPEQVVRDMAFGALLHMVQDSYSESHLARDFSTADEKPLGVIKGFHTYPGQKAKCHQGADSDPMKDGWWETARGKAVVAASKQLIQYRTANASLDEVLPWFESEVFSLSATPSRAKSGFGSR
ncbi:MAG: hypothetical protein IPG63_04640 [Xanthomonadales bacterium]|nr:hypothetical protein [Xanthomonadales bacterium]